MTPGQHVIVIGTESDALQARMRGLQLRDTLLILLPGPKTAFAFLFRQPLEGTVAENVLRYGTGGLNIDGCRVAHVTVAGGNHADNPHLRNPIRVGAESEDNLLFPRKRGDCLTPTNSLGRWPSNLVLVHGPKCQRLGEKQVKGSHAVAADGKTVANRTYSTPMNVYSPLPNRPVTSHVGKDGTETVTAWQCQPDCPVRMLDGQSGTRPGMPLQQNRNPDPSKRGWSGGWADSSPDFPGYGDAGGASRFFPQFANLAEALGWLSKLVTPC